MDVGQKLNMRLFSKGRRNWQRIAEIIGTRTSDQVRSHAQKYTLTISKKKNQCSDPQRENKQSSLVESCSAINDTQPNLEVLQAQSSKGDSNINTNQVALLQPTHAIAAQQLQSPLPPYDPKLFHTSPGGTHFLPSHTLASIPDLDVSMARNSTDPSSACDSQKFSRGTKPKPPELFEFTGISPGYTNAKSLETIGGTVMIGIGGDAEGGTLLLANDCQEPSINVLEIGNNPLQILQGTSLSPGTNTGGCTEVSSNTICIPNTSGGTFDTSPHSNISGMYSNYNNTVFKTNIIPSGSPFHQGKSLAIPTLADRPGECYNNSAVAPAALTRFLRSETNMAQGGPHKGEENKKFENQLLQQKSSVPQQNTGWPVPDQQDAYWLSALLELGDSKPPQQRTGKN